MTLFGFVNEVSLRGSGGQELLDDNKKVFVKSAMIRKVSNVTVYHKVCDVIYGRPLNCYFKVFISENRNLTHVEVPNLRHHEIPMERQDTKLDDVTIKRNSPSQATVRFRPG